MEIRIYCIDYSYTPDTDFSANIALAKNSNPEHNKNNPHRRH